jgi:lipoyl(octanoyl) transferase
MDTPAHVRRHIDARWLGQVRYRDALALQRRLRTELSPERVELLLLEHPPVFTVGRNSNALDRAVAAESAARLGADLEETDRGGQVTWHGPGQLVAWPVLDLSPDRRDVRRYVRDLQRVVVLVLADLGLEAEGRVAPEIGVWVGERKVCSIGVHLSRWRTNHGLALNLTNDLDSFRTIVACGMPGEVVASVAAVGGPTRSPHEVAPLLARRFAEVFDGELHWSEAAS